MKAYYDLTQRLKTIALADIDVNSVRKGDPSKMALDKQEMYGQVHFEVENFLVGDNGSITWGVLLVAMDWRAEKEETATDPFIGNHNEDDNLNSTAYILYRIVKVLTDQDDDYEVTNVSRAEVFTLGQNKDLVDGWRITFDVTMGIGDYTAC